MLLKRIITISTLLVILTGCIELPTLKNDTGANKYTNKYANKVNWIVSNNCKVQDNDTTLKRTLTWEGPCKDGYADGDGTLTWSIDNKPLKIYTGPMQKGIVEGIGELKTFATVDSYSIYKGPFKDGNPSGIGSLRTSNGSIYEGDFYQGTFHGDGTYTWKDAKDVKDRTVYVGSWVNGNQEGFGTMTITDKKIYQSFQSSKHGSLKKNKYIVVGMWKNNNIILDCANLDACVKAKEELTKIERIKAQELEKIAKMHGQCNTPTFTPTSNYKINRDEVYDTKTKLTWKRCLVGQTFDGNTCKGPGKQLFFDDVFANYGVSGNGWRLPNIDELMSLRSGGGQIINSKYATGLGTSETLDGCTLPAYNTIAFPGTSTSWSEGSRDPMKNPKYKNFITKYTSSNGGYQATMELPSQQERLWSSTASTNDKTKVYTVEFEEGYLGQADAGAIRNRGSMNYGRKDDEYVRLVKGPIYKSNILNASSAVQLKQSDKQVMQANENAFHAEKDRKEQEWNDRIKGIAATRAQGNGRRYYTCTYRCNTGGFFNTEDSTKFSVTIKADESWQADDQAKAQGTPICKAKTGYSVGSISCSEKN